MRYLTARARESHLALTLLPIQFFPASTTLDQQPRSRARGRDYGPQLRPPFPSSAFRTVTTHRSRSENVASLGRRGCAPACSPSSTSQPLRKPRWVPHTPSLSSHDSPTRTIRPSFGRSSLVSSD